VQLCAMADWRDSGNSQLVRFGFGCVKLGSMTRAAGGSAAKRLIREAIHSGVTFFDTADAYGAGTSERVLAAALGSDRSNVIVATKGGYLFRERSRLERGARLVVAPAFGAVRSIRSVQSWTANSALATKSAYAAQDFTASYLRRAVDDSLRRLRTDYIDVYQLHGPSSVCSDETLQLMAELVRVGKIRSFGVGLERLDRADEWCQLENLSRLQVPFGILDPEARETVFPAAGRAGVQIVARGIFGSGLFNSDPPPDGKGPYDSKLHVVQSLRLLANSLGTTPHQLAVWWVLAQHAVTTMLVGINSMDHLRSTVRYVTTTPSHADLIDRVDELIRPHAPGSTPG
jgi:aryl-alcohol dehydrogenase-like predicted oxidoreductase